MKNTTILFIVCSLLYISACQQKGNDASSGASKKITLDTGWHYRLASNKQWRPAQVPGNILTDLYKDGKLLVNVANGESDRFVEEAHNQQWEYHNEFFTEWGFRSYQNIDLVIKGIDTYAKVYLNDSLLGITSNMFRPYRFDIKNLLTGSKNKLVIRFLSADSVQTLMPWASVGERRAAFVQQRGKAPAIFAPVVLEAWDNAQITGAQIMQNDVTDNVAKVSALLDIRSSAYQNAFVTVTLAEQDMNISSNALQLIPGNNNVKLDFDIQNPKLWWANGMQQKPYVYNIKIKVLVDNKLVDSSLVTLGLRHIEILSPMKRDGYYTFMINNKELPMKAEHYAPDYRFLHNASKNTARFIDSLADAGVNMLRISGDGWYETDEFYDRCDQRGILLWHDLMFSHYNYPSDSGFISEVEAEMRYQLRRLRHHPSIAFWCGASLITPRWNPADSLVQFRIKGWERDKANEKLFFDVLPAMVRIYDQSHVYLSPDTFNIQPQTVETGKIEDKKDTGKTNDGKK